MQSLSHDSQPYDIVMLVLNDVAHDGRVQREARTLAAAGWRVLVVGTQRVDGARPDFEPRHGFDVRRVRYRRFGAQKWWPWRWIRHGLQAWQILYTLNGVSTRAYHAHDFPALVLLSMVRVAQRKPAALVYDAHELYLFMAPPKRKKRKNEPQRRRDRGDFFREKKRGRHFFTSLLMQVEGYLIRRAAAVITVSEVIARLLASWYGIPRPVVVQNALDPLIVKKQFTPEDAEIAEIFESKKREEHVSRVEWHAILDGRRWVVHTGRVTNRGRYLNELIAALALVPEDVMLVFLGPSQGEEGELLRWAERLNIRDRIVFVPPVEPDQVPAAIRSADAAAVLMRTETLNLRASLPGKFFEAISAGVPVVTSKQYNIVRLVRRYHLGQTCEPTDPESIALALREVLSPERQTFYRAQVAAAQQELNWEIEAAKLRGVYERVLGKWDTDKHR